ncbi:hypothetical protein V7x_20380 [Crateriforma conspicua]|uniref:Uncharacterized protein n=1 Tax=Crateriforma conspicua TaxID=2527996 RepID=A0A5C6FTV6_9PLAN|nr:hypothetical protein V7x_20380 [Crateriforma conspicua]
MAIWLTFVCDVLLWVLTSLRGVAPEVRTGRRHPIAMERPSQITAQHGRVQADGRPAVGTTRILRRRAPRRCGRCDDHCRSP